MNAQSYVFISEERKEKNSGTFEQYCATTPTLLHGSIFLFLILERKETLLLLLLLPYF